MEIFILSALWGSAVSVYGYSWLCGIIIINHNVIPDDINIDTVVGWPFSVVFTELEMNF